MLSSVNSSPVSSSIICSISKISCTRQSLSVRQRPATPCTPRPPPNTPSSPHVALHPETCCCTIDIKLSRLEISHVTAERQKPAGAAAAMLLQDMDVYTADFKLAMSLPTMGSSVTPKMKLSSFSYPQQSTAFEQVVQAGSEKWVPNGFCP